VKVVFLIFWVLSSCANPDPSEGIMEEDIFNIPALSAREVERLGGFLVRLNTSDRGDQVQVIRQIRQVGLKALPVLLNGLELGSASTQQGCLEILRTFVSGETTLQFGKRKNSEILAAWYIAELEKKYKKLPDPIEIGGRKRDPKKGREVYRQHLCVLYQDVGTPQLMLRFFRAVAGDRSALVRAAGYQALGQTGGRGALPRLIERYQNEEGIARDYLWQALKKMTGKNYPDDPQVWQAWLKQERRL